MILRNIYNMAITHSKLIGLVSVLYGLTLNTNGNVLLLLAKRNKLDLNIILPLANLTSFLSPHLPNKNGLPFAVRENNTTLRVCVNTLYIQ